MILRRKKQGCTVFLTTHNMAEAEKLCGRIALLNEGCIAEMGEPAELCRRYDRLKQLRVRTSDGQELSFPSTPSSAEAVAALIAGGRLETIHSSEPDLEAVFMELTGSSLNGREKRK